MESESPDCKLLVLGLRNGNLKFVQFDPAATHALFLEVTVSSAPLAALGPFSQLCYLGFVPDEPGRIQKPEPGATTGDLYFALAADLTLSVLRGTVLLGSVRLDPGIVRDETIEAVSVVSADIPATAESRIIVYMVSRSGLVATFQLESISSCEQKKLALKSSSTFNVGSLVFLAGRDIAQIVLSASRSFPRDVLKCAAGHAALDQGLELNRDLYDSFQNAGSAVKQARETGFLEMIVALGVSEAKELKNGDLLRAVLSHLVHNPAAGCPAFRQGLRAHLMSTAVLPVLRDIDSANSNSDGSEKGDTHLPLLELLARI